MTQKFSQWIAVAFFAGLVALVFQQIQTSMTEQGIAAGGPYDNAATFPKSVAIVIAGLLLIQIVLQLADRHENDQPIALAKLARPAIMLVLFGIYLSLLTTLGYHLTTAPMIVGVMWTCGARNLLGLIAAALAMSFVAAFVFENFLSVVLPGGMYALHIPW